METRLYFYCNILFCTNPVSVVASQNRIHLMPKKYHIKVTNFYKPHSPKVTFGDIGVIRNEPVLEAINNYSI